MDPLLESLARSMIDAIGGGEPRLSGIGDTLESAGKWIVDNALPIAEVAVPIIAPWTAPIVAAEHAIRTGVTLNHDQAKAATVAATKVGTAVAAQQFDTSGPIDPEMAPPAQPRSAPSSAPKSATPWLIAALAAAAFLL